MHLVFLLENGKMHTLKKSPNLLQTRTQASSVTRIRHNPYLPASEDSEYNKLQSWAVSKGLEWLYWERPETTDIHLFLR